MLHRRVKLSKNVAYRILLWVFLALIIFLSLVRLLRVFETLWKEWIVKRFCGSFISQISVFLYNPFLFLLLPAKELVSFPVWICKVIILSDGLPFWNCSFCLNSLNSYACSQGEQSSGLNHNVLYVIHFIKILRCSFFINQFMNYYYFTPPQLCNSVDFSTLSDLKMILLYLSRTMTFSCAIQTFFGFWW